MRRYPQGGFSVAKRMTRVRRPGGGPGRAGAGVPRRGGGGGGRGGRGGGGGGGRAGWVVQRRARSWRCQRRMVAGVTSSARRRGLGSSRVRVVSRARSVQVIRGRGVRRWSTVSW